uniref:Uncharacterized protein n=1 Tax=Romanomermis culicivorax TaxID=13658 RepID=A0A915KHE4_ROMCU
MVLTSNTTEWNKNFPFAGERCVDCIPSRSVPPEKARNASVSHTERLVPKDFTGKHQKCLFLIQNIIMLKKCDGLEKIAFVMHLEKMLCVMFEAEISGSISVTRFKDDKDYHR